MVYETAVHRTHFFQVIPVFLRSITNIHKLIHYNQQQQIDVSEV